MATENTITSTPAVDVHATAHSDCSTIGELLAAERKISIHWWTMLNEMRFRGLLPDWVKNQPVGNSIDHDEYEQVRVRTDAAILGFVPSFVYEVWGQDQHRLSGRLQSIVEAKEERARLGSEYPDARIVRVHYQHSGDFVDADALVGNLRWTGDGVGGQPEEVDVSVEDENGNWTSIGLHQLLERKELLARFDKKSLERIYSAHNWITPN